MEATKPIRVDPGVDDPSRCAECGAELTMGQVAWVCPRCGLESEPIYDAPFIRSGWVREGGDIDGYLMKRANKAKVFGEIIQTFNYLAPYATTITSGSSMFKDTLGRLLPAKTQALFIHLKRASIRSCPPSHRRLVALSKVLENVVRLLGISITTWRRTGYLYKVVCHRDVSLAKAGAVNPNALLAVCFYLAAKEGPKHFSLNSIQDAFKTIRHSFTTRQFISYQSRCTKLVTIKPSPGTIEEYVSRVENSVSNKMHSPAHQIYMQQLRTAMGLLGARVKHVIALKPGIRAGTLIYAADKLAGEQLTLCGIAAACETNDVSIRHYYKTYYKQHVAAIQNQEESV